MKFELLEENMRESSRDISGEMLKVFSIDRIYSLPMTFIKKSQKYDEIIREL